VDSVGVLFGRLGEFLVSVLTVVDASSCQQETWFYANFCTASKDKGESGCCQKKLGPVL
jgi:hypothetical protein